MQGPSDRRRNHASEASASLRFGPSLSSFSHSSGLRAGGRQQDEVRSVCKYDMQVLALAQHIFVSDQPLVLKLGLVTEASGSVYIETGKTKMICAVYGPKPTAPSASFSAKVKLNVDVKYSPYSSGVRRIAPGKDTEAQALSAFLHQALLPSIVLDALPKSQIDVYLTIIESDNSASDISAGVTAASVALAAAGVQMLGLVIGCCIGVAGLPGVALLLDPDYFESTSLFATVQLACMPAHDTFTNMQLRGTLKSTQLEQVLEKGMHVCSNIHAVAKAALIEAEL